MQFRNGKHESTNVNQQWKIEKFYKMSGFQKIKSENFFVFYLLISNKTRKLLNLIQSFWQMLNEENENSDYTWENEIILWTYGESC